ncbi:PREDICTED: uncharacterized protein LOC104605478 [Nelumbo nucifera]|uniref:Uncharacterized protein LOC104605478 n=1 Tax=Nelumbo nucifera TaxID=4432 RepID=A0A1U8AZF9_NELNU|nr:PREDICTED: uncharacterized protein LOC104605478 [Nelumbo nucifera]
MREIEVRLDIFLNVYDLYGFVLLEFVKALDLRLKLLLLCRTLSCFRASGKSILIFLGAGGQNQGRFAIYLTPQPLGGQIKEVVLWRCARAALVWTVWEERNAKIFNDKERDEMERNLVPQETENVEVQNKRMEQRSLWENRGAEVHLKFLHRGIRREGISRNHERTKERVEVVVEEGARRGPL